MSRLFNIAKVRLIKVGLKSDEDQPPPPPRPNEPPRLYFFGLFNTVILVIRKAARVSYMYFVCLECL